MSFALEPPLLEHLNASLQVIEIGCSAHYRGAGHAYRPVATELRKLLCDTQGGRDNSLLVRCFPRTHLHVVTGGAAMIDEMTALYIPGRVTVGGSSGSELDFVFDEAGAMLPLSDWVEQPLLNGRVTVKSLIRSVADKESAHADASTNDTLRLARSVLLGDETLAGRAIIAIARYVAKGIIIRALVATRQAPPFLATTAGRRGYVQLDIGQACRQGIHVLPLEFHEAADLAAVSSFTEANRADATQLLAGYAPDREYILLTLDLNRRLHSLYKIGLCE